MLNTRLSYCLAALTLVLVSGAGQSQWERTEVEGLVCWTTKDKGSSPAFVKLVQDLLGFVVGEQSPLYSRSIALLIGVSDYRSLEPLPAVRTDIKLMRGYLMEHGGFDQIYLLEDDAASPTSVRDFMLNRLKTLVSGNDRVFVYFSGHGDETGGQTGYLQFGDASPGDFAREVLPISEILE